MPKTCPYLEVVRCQNSLYLHPTNFKSDSYFGEGQVFAECSVSPFYVCSTVSRVADGGREAIQRMSQLKHPRQPSVTRLAHAAPCHPWLGISQTLRANIDLQSISKHCHHSDSGPKLPGLHPAGLQSKIGRSCAAELIFADQEISDREQE